MSIRPQSWAQTRPSGTHGSGAIRDTCRGPVTLPRRAGTSGRRASRGFVSITSTAVIRSSRSGNEKDNGNGNSYGVCADRFGSVGCIRVHCIARHASPASTTIRRRVDQGFRNGVCRTQSWNARRTARGRGEVPRVSARIVRAIGSGDRSSYLDGRKWQIAHRRRAGHQHERRRTRWTRFPPHFVARRGRTASLSTPLGRSRGREYGPRACDRRRARDAACSPTG